MGFELTGVGEPLAESTGAARNEQDKRKLHDVGWRSMDDVLIR